MTLTINVPDEVAAQVRSAAKARGQDIESFGTGAVLDAVSVLADTNDFERPGLVAEPEPGRPRGRSRGVGC